MIINIAHTKGGVGKTTIATNLSITLNAPIIDLDLQKSSKRFMRLRSLSNLSDLPVFDELTDQLLNEYKGNHKKHLIIDSGGMDNNIIRQGLEYSDLIITPVSISQVEFFGLQDFDELLNCASSTISRDKTYVLLNNINTRSKKEITMAKEFIKSDFNFNMFTSMIGSRKTYKDAYAEGKSVIEKGKKTTAASELTALIIEIKKIIKKV